MPPEFGDVVVPKLIFHKKHFLWLYQVDKGYCILAGVEGEITHNVGTGVVFPNLVARW